MLMNHGLDKVNISPNTPTANAAIESVHKVMGQIIRTIFNSRKPTNVKEFGETVDECVAHANFSCRCAANTSLQGLAPGSVVFGRDMHMNIPVVSDLLSIGRARQNQTDQRVFRENARRVPYDYAVGNMVYVKHVFKPADKIKEIWKGPFPILRVHTNNTVTVQRGQIHERMSIRRIKPSRS